MEIFILEWYCYDLNRTDFIRAYSSLDFALELTPKPKDRDGEFMVSKTVLNDGGYTRLLKRVISSDGYDDGWKDHDSFD